ncbi:MAG: acyl carrier protein [Holosporales bacterium]|jgi:acyl carrier protein|nr:acyl carrier protein [Holosporales bacterium]
MLVRDRVLGIVHKHVKIAEEKITDDANLANDLGVDSLTLFEIILDMEKEFACEIPEKESNDIVSLGSAIAYIESKIVQGLAK